jgi:iron complex outermembrane recepter protein
MATPRLLLFRTVFAPLAAAIGSVAWAQTESTRLPQVVVETMAPPAGLRRAEVSTLSSAPLSETPLSAGVIDAERLRERGAASLSAAIRDEPAASDAYNTVGYIEALQVRGFRLDSLLNYRRDGLPLSNHAPIALENKEAIEIVKGVAGVLGGSGAPGGLVNYRLKQPTDAPLRSLLAEVSERGTVLAQGDFGGRMGAGGQFGYRINLAAAERRPQARDADGQRRFASGFFDWRLNVQTTIAAEIEHHAVRQISVPGYGLFDVDGDGVAETLPAPISPRLNLNDQPWAEPFESRATTGSLRAAHQFAETWRAEVQASAQRIRTHDRIAFPDGCSSGPNYVYPGLCRNGDIDIYDFRSEDERRRTRTFDAFVAGAAATGAVTHELRFGVRRTRYSERFPPLQAYNFVGTTNVFAPVVLPADPTPGVPNTQSDLRSDELSATDVLRAGPFSAWFGVRWVRLERESLRSDGAEASRFDQRFVAPWLALGWQPWTGGFGYASFGRGVEIESVPNRPADFVNSGAALPALRSEQVELGFKQVTSAGHALAIALFAIDKPYGDDLLQADGRKLRVAGAREARHRGVEATGVLVATRALRLEGRAAWIDAKTTRAVDPALVGKRTTNVAPFAASAAARWNVAAVPGLELNNLLTYSGRKPVTADGGVELPSYWQWDIAASYRWLWAGTRMTLAAGIDNLTDRRYWREAPTQYWGGIYLFPAQPRSARLSLAANW